MSSTTVSTRISKEEAAALEALAAFSGIERSSLIKSMLRKGIQDLRLEQAVRAFREEKATLSKAAELAGLEIRDFMARMKTHGLDLHYDVEEFTDDLRVFEEGE